MLLFFKKAYPIYKWLMWFFLSNIFFALLIIAQYFHYFPNLSFSLQASYLQAALTWLFVLTTFIAQLSFLFFIPYIVIVMVTALFPNRWFVITLSVTLVAILLLLLIVDSIIFNLYHVHYASLAWRIVQAGAASAVILLSFSEELLLVGIISGLVLLEYLLAHWIWRRLQKYSMSKKGLWLIGLIFFSMLTSYGIMGMATGFFSSLRLEGDFAQSILKIARLVPYYNEVYELLLWGHDSTVRTLLTKRGPVTYQIQQKNHKLSYPLHIMQCHRYQHPLNIVLIVIDTWRFDALSASVTPNIYKFSKKTLQFNNHWSGGNCTRAGLVSLFYSLPDNYWLSLLNQKKTPVFFNQIQKQGYRIGIYASAPLTFPAFHQTIFKAVQDLDLYVPGANSIERDHEITNRFIHFLKNDDQKQPFFSFLFYDAVHNYCDMATPRLKPFQPAVSECDRFALTADMNPRAYVNRYKNAVHFVDDEVGQVLNGLKKYHKLKNTVVIITADHGEQLNDEHMGYWDHASAYTPYQLHVPLVVYWPNHQPTQYAHLTTHYDIIPTLMDRVLNCKNSFEDYSVGQLLLTVGARPFVIAGSYSDYAVLTPNQVVRVYPGGDLSITNRRGHLLSRVEFDHSIFKKVFYKLNQYFKK